MAKKENDKNIELGFGKKQYDNYTGFLNKDGSVNIRRYSGGFFNSYDFFHASITMPWKKFILYVLVLYAIVNLVFATLYYNLGLSSFGNLTAEHGPGRFWELFFFSAQTLTTVGYGYIYPKSTPASTIAAIESMMGLLGFALATGILYGRFSRPKSDIIYSKNIIRAPYEEGHALMFRIANPKQNELIEAEAKVILTAKNDKGIREFLPLNLETKNISFLALSWTIVHPIDENSPVVNYTVEEFKKREVEVIILIKSINDTYMQTVYSRSSYKFNDLVWGAKFTPINSSTMSNGKILVDVSQISNYTLVQ